VALVPSNRAARRDHPAQDVMLRTYLSFIRFSHSVFALPFALTGVLLAARVAPVAWQQVAWVIIAMVAARSAAMSFNRLVDADMDARNPRTAMREIPRGVISRPAAAVFVALSSIVFVAAAGALSWLCLVLAPAALAIVFWYSLAKRYTSYTQAFLGLAMAVAPVGGWLAAGGRGGWEPWLLGLAIGLWVGGFDILYACQDVAFDRAHGLNSIPVRFGVARSIAISRAMHVGAIVAMVLVGRVAGLGGVYVAGVCAVALLLAYEQSLVSASDLSQVKRAFDLNGYVGLLYFMTTAAAIYIQ
jgi:4-hydroxybenzoate polyprenyltransferase